MMSNHREAAAKRRLADTLGFAEREALHKIQCDVLRERDEIRNARYAHGPRAIAAAEQRLAAIRAMPAFELLENPLAEIAAWRKKHGVTETPTIPVGESSEGWE
jgi:hypothetical protein